MKRTVLILSVVCLMGSLANAQNADSEISSRYQTTSPAASRVKLVPTVGYSSSIVEGFESNMETHVYRRSLMNGGLLVEAGSGQAAFQTGLVYMQEGLSATSFRLNGTSFENSYVDGRLDYIGIPLLGKITFPTSGSGAAIYGKFGVIPAYLAAANIKSGWSMGSRNEAYESNDKDGLRAVNVFGELGAGIAFKGANEFRLEALYERSLLSTNVNAESVKIFTNSFMLNVGMAVGIL